MSALKDAQQEAIATIDAAQALVDKVLAILQLIDLPSSLTKNIPIVPIKYLLYLLGEIGVTQEDLINFLSNFLVGVLPALEVSVKAIMLTNLKSMVTCTADPRIQDKYRKTH